MSEDRLAQALEELFHIMCDPDLETHEQADAAIKQWNDKYPDYADLVSEVAAETSGK